LDKLIVITSSHNTNFKSYPYFCQICQPISSNVSTAALISVEELQNGTSFLSGTMRFQLDIVNADGHVSVHQSDGFSIQKRTSHMELLLQSLPGVDDANVTLIEQTIEGRSVWMLSMDYNYGDMPLLTILSDNLQGSEVKIYVEKAASGVAEMSGTFQLRYATLRLAAVLWQG
jgi:hypothetical protein